MKSVCLLLVVLVMILPIDFYAQSSIPFSSSSYIVPYKLEVTENKTTNLIFPAPIVSVDRGSQQILVDKSAGINNFLRIKAKQKMFEETNLNVITADGKLYSFIVQYSKYPAYLNVDFRNSHPSASNRENSEVIVSTGLLNEPQINVYSALAALEKGNIKSLKDRSLGMKLVLSGLYVKDNYLFFKVAIANKTSIDYDIELTRLFIRDQKQLKYSTLQEVEIVPLYHLGNIERVEGHKEHTIILALSRFTIPDKKYVLLQLMEANGGRHLQLKITNRILFKAKPL